MLPVPDQQYEFVPSAKVVDLDGGDDPFDLFGGPAAQDPQQHARQSYVRPHVVEMCPARPQASEGPQQRADQMLRMFRLEAVLVVLKTGEEPFKGVRVE